VGFLWYKIS